MSYENKEYIIQFFEGVHEEENRAELLEVYRKAKAFDKVLHSYDTAPSYNEIGEEVIEVVNKFRGE